MRVKSREFDAEGNILYKCINKILAINIFRPGGNDVWGWTDPLNGDEYAIMCLKGATTFVRITDPAHPVPVGIIYSA